LVGSDWPLRVMETMSKERSTAAEKRMKPEVPKVLQSYVPEELDSSRDNCDIVKRR